MPVKPMNPSPQIVRIPAFASGEIIPGKLSKMSQRTIAMARMLNPKTMYIWGVRL